MHWGKVALFTASLAPLGWMVYGAYAGKLGANPVEYITRGTGDWTLRFLVLGLAVTPVRRLLRWPELVRYRRMLGLFAFFYGCLHLTTWLWLDKFWDVGEMIADLKLRRFILAGMVAFVPLVPLAITSTDGWMRRLGRRWAQLHRLVYLSAVAGVVHYWWLVKSDIREPLLYGAAVAVLLVMRWWRPSWPSRR